MIGQALLQYGPMMEEMLPVELVEKYRLMPRREAVTHIHHPEDTQGGTSCPPKTGL